jgi:hypothetical protein
MDDDLLAVERIDKHHSICISTLARSTVQELEADHLGGDRGYFIYEVDDTHGGGINILGKAASYEAAFRLIELWQQGPRLANRALRLLR